MDKVVNKLVQIDLAGTDVDYLTRGNAKVKLYKELQNSNSIIDFFEGYKNIIMLFPVQSDDNGHWICLTLHENKKTINHFDSYGLSWIQERSYTKNQYVKEHLLGNLYQQAQNEGWKITWNKYRLQTFSNQINSCGRWACIRARMSYLNNDEFASLFLKQRYTADQLITMITFVALNQDETQEEAIIRSAS